MLSVCGIEEKRARRGLNDEAWLCCTRTGFEGECRDVDDYFGTGLEDDEEHADRA